MTILIADNSPRISYTATSGQTAFTVPFEFFDNTDLNVYINDTIQTLTTHYTVTGGSGSTGSITLVTGATAGDVVVITRDVTLERTTDFPTSGPFQVASLNTELDKVVAMIADMKDLADRGLRLSDSDTSAALVLANKDDRKGTVLAFNETTGAVEIGPTIADTNSIAQIKADIALLADIQDGTVATNAITTVSSISSDVTTVSSNNTNVTTVAGQTTNMQNITDNLTAVQNAATNATNAAASATAAATSETNAATSETNAATSETNAATSATNASTSATAASTSASAASTSATAAASSATAAATSETNAGTSETNAATSATNAATSATNAGTSETNAASSATAAAASATSASNAQTAAESARDSALASFDSFDDRYLGTKTSDPTVDNDGDALVAGALYFNSTDGEMKVYNGTSWVDAYADGASLVAKSGDTMTGNLSFGDNNKAIFGAGNDLQIYHNGSASYIQDVGTGDLNLLGSNLTLGTGGGTETYISAVGNGAVTLYHDNSAKLATTSTGIDVTGGVSVATDGTGLAIDSSSNAYMVIDRGASNRRGELVFSTASADVLNAPPLSATTDWALGVSDSDELAGDAFYIGTASGATSAKMVITQSGDVGIGSSAPDKTLVVSSSSGTEIVINDSDATPNPILRFREGGSTSSTISTSSQELIFSTPTTEKMRINSSGAEIQGNLIIDNQSPVLEFQPDGNYTPKIDFSDGGEFSYATAVNTFYWTVGGNATRLSLDSSGNLVAAGNITAYSDERLKDNIETLDGSKVYEMRGVSFTKDGKAGSGVVAQELQKIAPELVHEQDEYLSVAYGNLVGYLIEAVKDLKAEIEELKDASTK